MKKILTLNYNTVCLSLLLLFASFLVRSQLDWYRDKAESRARFVTTCWLYRCTYVVLFCTRNNKHESVQVPQAKWRWFIANWCDDECVDVQWTGWCSAMTWEYVDDNNWTKAQFRRGRGGGWPLRYDPIIWLQNWDEDFISLIQYLIMKKSSFRSVVWSKLVAAATVDDDERQHAVCGAYLYIISFLWWINQLRIIRPKWIINELKRAHGLWLWLWRINIFRMISQVESDAR